MAVMHRNLVLILSWLAALPALATNYYFLPGDAFFSVSISQAKMEEWTADTGDKLELEYARFDGQFFACGDLGYSALTVEGVTPAFRQALAEAYWRFVDFTPPVYREEGSPGKSVLEQINNVVALVYNKGGAYTPGLKFNENWREEGGYAGYFEDAKPVIRDWQLAAEIPALAVREKLDPKAHLTGGYEVAHTINTPLHIAAAGIQIVLVGFTEQRGNSVMQRCPQLQAIYDGEEDARYMIVTENLITNLECDENGTWSEEEIPIPLPPSLESAIPKKS